MAEAAFDGHELRGGKHAISKAIIIDRAILPSVIGFSCRRRFGIVQGTLR
jgi:hypothetical protein